MNHIPNDEISLKEIVAKVKEYYTYLRSKWRIVGLAVVIGALLGLTYSFIKKPVYTATLSFAIEGEQNGGGLNNALGLANTLGLNLDSGGGGIFAGANLTELFKSRSMVEKTLLYPINLDGKKTTLAEKFTRAHDSILGVMYKKLSETDLLVDQKDKQISIITIDVNSGNEIFAKYFCENLALQVSKFYISTKSKKARINMSILERQTDSIRNELNGAIIGAAIATDNTFNLNPALNVQRSPLARKQVDVQANTAILTELVKQTEMAKVTLRKDMPLIQVIDKPILPLPITELSKIKGIILGSLLFVFFTITFFIIQKIFKNI